MTDAEMKKAVMALQVAHKKMTVANARVEAALRLADEQRVIVKDTAAEIAHLKDSLALGALSDTKRPKKQRRKHGR